MAEKLIVEAKVREFVKGCNDEIRISEDFLVALNSEVCALVAKAVARAVKNGRKTLHSQDV